MRMTTLRIKDFQRIVSDNQNLQFQLAAMTAERDEAIAERDRLASLVAMATEFTVGRDAKGEIQIRQRHSEYAMRENPELRQAWAVCNNMRVGAWHEAEQAWGLEDPTSYTRDEAIAVARGLCG